MFPKIVYWSSTAIVAVALLGALTYLTGSKQVVSGFARSGYPQHLRIVLGFAKPAAAIVLLAPGLPLLKEWAYAGVTFAWVMATIAAYSIGDGVQAWGMPLVPGAQPGVGRALRRDLWRLGRGDLQGRGSVPRLRPPGARLRPDSPRRLCPPRSRCSRWRRASAPTSGESQTANTLGGHVHADRLAALVTGELEHKAVLGLKHVAEQIRQRTWFDPRPLQDEFPGMEDKCPCHIQFPAVIRSREPHEWSCGARRLWHSSIGARRRPFDVHLQSDRHAGALHEGEYEAAGRRCQPIRVVSQGSKREPPFPAAVENQLVVLLKKTVKSPRCVVPVLPRQRSDGDSA